MFEPNLHELTVGQLDAWRVCKLDPHRGANLMLDGIDDRQDLCGHSGEVLMVISPSGFVHWIDQR